MNRLVINVLWQSLSVSSVVLQGLHIVIVEIGERLPVMARDAAVHVEQIRDERRAHPHAVARLPEVHRARILVDIERDFLLSHFA